MQCVNVDTTVQEKAIRFPTDARTCDRMRERLVKIARDEGVVLRQSYRRVGKRTLRRQSNYARAQQFKRAAKQTKKLKTILGRVVRDIERKQAAPSDVLQELINNAKRLLQQEKKSKNKLYSVHEPQVECIGKGKAHKRFEFGCKVGFTTSAKGNWVLSAQAFHGNPYDGHTLKQCLTKFHMATSKGRSAIVMQRYRTKAHSMREGRFRCTQVPIRPLPPPDLVLPPLTGRTPRGHHQDRRFPYEANNTQASQLPHRQSHH